MSASGLFPTLRFGAPYTTARAAVILLHGRGASATDIAEVGMHLDAPDLAYLVPNAPGGSWYPQRFLVPTELNEPALTQSLAVIAALVKEVREAGLGADLLGFIGFSQGACLALEFAARQPARYAFVGALSGALLGPIALARPTGDLLRTPVLLGCAERDAHIPHANVAHSAAVLADFNAAVTTQIFPGSAHTVFPEEVDWLRRQIAALAPRSGP
jgi:phospholipase/carboxylesterase